MDLQAFFAENSPPFPEKTISLSDRLPAPFRLRAISEQQNALLRRQIAGASANTIDPAEYFAKLAAACVVEPDLNNAALQRSWGVMGADALLCKMLSAGEYAKLIEAVQAVCGFDLPVRKVADDIKKEPCGAIQNSITPTTPCMN